MEKSELKNEKLQGNKRSYEKPETKKHESMNIVQGSGLYYTSLYKTGLYHVTLYYRY